MKYRRLIAGLILIVFSLAAAGSLVLAAGFIYYGPEGINYSRCGSGIPCETYYYTSRRACQLSENAETTYFIYHTSYGYAGYCDMAGGGGVEPGADEVGIRQYWWLRIIRPALSWTGLSLMTAGFVVGLIVFRRPAEA